MSHEKLALAVRDRRPFGVGMRADGRVLNDYFDGHRILSDPHLLRALVGELHTMIRHSAVEYVAGEVTAGSVLATAVSLHSVDSARPLEARGIRKVAKTHGVTGILTTPIPKGARVALVDDVAGTGDALVRSIRALRTIGCHVTGAYVLLDREQGAAQAVEEYGLRLASLFRLRDLAPDDREVVA